MDNDALVTTQSEVPVLEPAPLPEGTATAAPIPEGMVNETPDPAALQSEIDRLKKVREEAEEKAVYWRKQKAEARAEYFKGRGDPPPVQPPVVEDLGIGPEPKQDNFDDYQKYLDAKINYEVNKAKTQWDRDIVRKQQDEARNQRMAELQEKIGEGYKKYSDFEEVALDRTVPITPVIMEILADTSNPGDIAYYLGKNRAEAIQISRMTPIQATRKIAQIETELAKSGGLQPPRPPPKLTNAPPPIKPLGASHTVGKPFENMTQREFEAEMEKRTGRRF